ncbi:MAG: four helix bundle protein [Bacteroidales bacterium]|jgi:four helix bundle protein
MATVNKFEDLEVWQIARDLCKMIFILTNHPKFKQDTFLKNQIRASSGSAMDNIAEGFGRAGKNEFIQFLGISNGSACEVKSQLYRALDQDYILKTEFNEAYSKTDLLNNKLGGFINYLNKCNIKGEKFKDRVKS